MKTNYFLLAEFASIDAVGKQNILGVFTQIRAREFPYSHYSMHAAISLDSDTNEMIGKKELNLRITSEDNEEIREISAEYDFPPHLAEEKKDIVILFSIRDLEFPHPGEYDFTLSIENQRIASQQLTLLSQPQEVA